MMFTTRDESHARIPFQDELALLASGHANTDTVFQVADRNVRRPELMRPMEAIACSHKSFRKLYEARYQPGHVSLESLERLPAGTLGREYARHLRSNNLDPSFYTPLEAVDPGTYFALRLRQTHDIWHVLTGYDVSPVQELALQAFGVAQYGAPLGAVLISYGLLTTADQFPWSVSTLMDAVVDGYTRGKKAEFLAGVPWESLWDVPLDTLREQHGLAGK